MMSNKSDDQEQKTKGNRDVNRGRWKNSRNILARVAIN